MNRSEVLGVMSVLKAAYPNFYRGMSRNDAEDAVNLWCDIFRDDDAGAVGLAVKEFIAGDSKGYPPSLGQLRTKLPKRNMRAIGGPGNGQRKWQARYRRLTELRRAVNIPETWDQAQKAGMTAAQYNQLNDEAGISPEAWLWP